MKQIHKFVERYRITSGKNFRFKDIDPEDTAGLKSEFKKEAQKLLQKGVEHLAQQQEMLYAQDRWGLLLIFQAMDAAGKDGTIKHVMSGINPQGCQVFSFKAPSSEELDHDFLWRCVKNTPERGRIGIFNRSYYEEVLIVRVHQEILRNQRLPRSLVTQNIWKERFEDIRNYERYLTRNGIAIRKFFLHISKGEQKKRFLARLAEPEKYWKFSMVDVQERDHWQEYMDAYEEMIQHTATDYAPWYVVPANAKWFARLVVAAAVIIALQGMKLSFPKVGAEKLKELAAARKALKARKQDFR